MNYFDYWEYEIIDFLKGFVETELDYSSVKGFLKIFELEHYELFVDLKKAKSVILVYGKSEYAFTLTDLSWISENTKVLICSFEDRNLIFVDLESSQDTYYINSAAFIKIFNKAFPNNNCYIFKTCNGLAIGSMRCFSSNVENNFCVTQLFTEECLGVAAEFFDEILFGKYETIPSAIISYSPQERVEYVKPLDHYLEWDCFEEENPFKFPDEPIIYATYTEACDVLRDIANKGDESSFDVLEEAIISEQKVMAAPTGTDNDTQVAPSIEGEQRFSDEAYADAEQMLKEMLEKK